MSSALKSCCASARISRPGSIKNSGKRRNRPSGRHIPARLYLGVFAPVLHRPGRLTGVR